MVSNQLISLASREMVSAKATYIAVRYVSNQLISLASREKLFPKRPGTLAEVDVSNQLISLASREENPNQALMMN